MPAAAQQAGPQYLDAKQALAVQQALNKAVEKTKAPVVLRLAFHDSATWDAAARDGGANASIRLELDRPENFGLKRGWRVVEAALKELKGTSAEGAVSAADMVALAGAHAVAITGGPIIRVPIGRVAAPAADPADRLPDETLSALQLRAAFADKGLSAREMVALLGAHTLGSKGFGEPLAFDNAYYTGLLAKPWADASNTMAAMIGLPSDRVLPDDPACRPVVEEYARDQALFFREFAAAYVKLTSLGAQWRTL